MTGGDLKSAGYVRGSLAAKGSESLKGGRTILEGAWISGTAEADWDRDEPGMVRGLERMSVA